MRKEYDHTFIGNRYKFDTGECSAANGWAQLDTRQDAWYFGMWAHPVELKIVIYAEGDLTSIFCDTKEEFVEEIKSIAEWNKENGYSFGVDAFRNEQPWIDLGLRELLH